MSDLSPIRLELRVGCSRQHAFDTFTGRISEWWDPRLTAGAETLESVTIEPRMGGRVYERHRDGSEYEWGAVTAWEPGRRFVQAFTLAQDPAQPSEVAVDFVEESGGCLVRFAHGGWTDANVAERKKFSEWPRVLDRFAALAESST